MLIFLTIEQVLPLNRLVGFGAPPTGNRSNGYHPTGEQSLLVIFIVPCFLLLSDRVFGTTDSGSGHDIDLLFFCLFFQLSPIGREPICCWSNL